VNSRSEIAMTKFSEGYNCAQSVFFAFCEFLNFEEDLALKMVCGFGAGMGRKEEVCGAVTGAIVVIGTKFGRGLEEESSATELTYRKTGQLMDRFAEKHGTFICRKLIRGYDLNTEEGQKQFKEADFLNSVCKPCVQCVVEILEDLMQ